MLQLNPMIPIVRVSDGLEGYAFLVIDYSQEHNLLFTAENDWITDIDSLHKERPSKLFIEAVEPSVILQISKGDLWYLYTNYPKLITLGILGNLT